ncbi:MAG: monovalent cation/H(+) antiporter subunit G [Bacteroidales bacterium]|jgi:multicomponent Na+:H+ antiporter subunit G|nr:monovalent cation/H(+) antiporter subunit G [Bacteroidales bacterium]HOI31321.1 monovalent cation/H(+) antiporter subunit G [Bacteroidales bacterium]
MEFLIAIVLLLASFFTLVASLGIIRLHDVYMRMHAITKASSLATILFLIALILAHPGWRIVLGSLLLIMFIIATAPISTHALARISVHLGIKMSKGMVRNDMKTGEESETEKPEKNSEDENIGLR